MSQFNKIILIGTVSSSVQKKELSSGSEVSTFSLTVQRTAAEGAVAGEDVFSVVCWDSVQEAQSLVSGQSVLVEGSIRNRSYDNNGGRVYVTEIYARRVKPFSAEAASSATAGEEAVIPILEESPAAAPTDFNEQIKEESAGFDQQLETEDVPF